MLNSNDKILYKRLLQYLKPHKKALLCLVFATIIYGLTEPLVPLVLQPLIDGGFAQENKSIVYRAIFLLFFGFLIRGAANFSADYSTAYLAQNVVKNIRTEMFAKLLKQPLLQSQQESNGQHLSRFTYDVLQLISASTDALAILVRESVTIIALLMAMIYFDWRLTLFVLALAPFLVGLIIFISKRLRRFARNLQNDMGELNHNLEEVLRAREVIRIYQGEELENKRFQAQIEQIYNHLLKSSKISASISPIIEVLIISALCSVILWAAIYLVPDKNSLSIGNLVSFLGAMALLFPPIKRLGKVSEPIQRGLAAMQSIFTYLDLPEEKSSSENFVIKQGDIELKNVSFTLANKEVLQNISFTIKAGQTVALVGESGSGKSTLAALIAGFYELQSGKIYFDNCDSENISLAARRSALAYVTQETMLFSRSIKDNIVYADSYDEDRLICAARSAYAFDFIDKLPEKFATILGSTGINLSGGQKQRISLARAFYKNAPILILDEATSALDVNSENQIRSALQELRKNRSCLIIAHRLQTIQDADLIIVLAQGKIVEQGTHQQLSALNGYYSNLLKKTNS